MATGVPDDEGARLILWRRALDRGEFKPPARGIAIERGPATTPQTDLLVPSTLEASAGYG